jgi:cell division protease FtsH
MWEALRSPTTLRDAWKSYWWVPVTAFILGVGALVAVLLSKAAPAKTVSLSVVLRQARAGLIRAISLNDQVDRLTAVLKSGVHEVAGYPYAYASHLVQSFPSIEFTSSPAATPTILTYVIKEGFIFGCLGLLMLFIMKKMMPSSKKMTGPLGAGQIPTTRFSDVAGLAEVVEEVAEVVEFLHNPKVFEAAGARIPHGFLLIGPPGTGKTLLARALAGEAGVPFYSLAGSDFLDTFVGVGAAKVRKVFAQARKSEKAIIFIDELDAVARARSSQMQNAGTDESDRTLNALLVELDGFVQSSIIVLAATNRPEVLDPALLRPGRFDRKITFNAPDRSGREQILNLAARPLTLGPDVDLSSIAGRTAGLTGADLHFLTNEAALTAARNNETTVTMTHLEKATEVTFLGRARTSLAVSQKERDIVANHESGHATLAYVLPDAPKPVRVSIIPRGGAGGVTWMESDDNHFVSRNQALAQLTVMMGGRAGEMLVHHANFTSGAESDLRVAIKLAREMVVSWGMGPLGLLYVADSANERDDDVTSSINKLLQEALENAKNLLLEHKSLHTAITQELLKAETVTAARLEELVAEIEKTAL